MVKFQDCKSWGNDKDSYLQSTLPSSYEMECTPPCWRHLTQDMSPDVEKCTPPCWRHPTLTWPPGALLCRPPGPSPHTSGPIFTSPCWPVPCWLLHLATCRSRPTFPALLHDGQVGGGSSRAIFTFHGFTAVHQHHHHTIFNPVLISQNDQHHYIRNQKKNRKFIFAIFRQVNDKAEQENQDRKCSHQFTLSWVGGQV